MLPLKSLGSRGTSMRINGKQIVLSLTQRRLAGAMIRGGKAVQVEAIDLDPALWGTAWSEGLMAYDSEIRRVLTRLQAGKETPVTVLYNSPSAVLACFDLPGTPGEACAAASLQIRDPATGFSVGAAYPIAPAASGNGCWSVLAISERDEAANALFGWVTRAGARLVGLVPIQFAVAIEASRCAASDEELTAECLIGRDWTAVACGASDAFHLIRVFELGYGAMSDVHAQVATSQNKNSDGHASLFEIGVPFKNRDIHPADRSMLLPLLSPIIQRLCIEIKQTLRFGLSGAHMPATLNLNGVAGRIPELVPALVEGVDMHIEADMQGTDTEDPTAAFTHGSIEQRFLAFMDKPIRIRPEPLVSEDAARTFRRATMVGAAVSVIAIGLEYGWIGHQRAQIESEFASMSNAVAMTAAHREQQESAREVALRAGRVGLKLLDSIEFTPNTGRVLTQIASAVPQGVELTSIDLRRTGGDPGLTISGIATGDSDDAAGRSLNEFIAGVTAKPEVSSVELGATQREHKSGTQVSRVFSVRLKLTEMPPEYAPLAMFAQREEEE